MSNETAILQLIHTPGLGRATLSRLLKVLELEGCSLDEFLSLPVNEIIKKYRLKAEIVETLKVNSNEAQKLLSQLHQQDIHILVRNFYNYPHHLIKILGDNAPPVLFAKGNLDILKNIAVGFSGSRKTSEKGLTKASNAAGLLADKGVNVVSGYASGTDLAAHCGALSSSGTTTFVLAEGILHFKIKREIADYINNKNYLAISEFPPQTKWIARNAMQRNSTICGLSDAMIIVESGLDGGTFAAGETTLQLNLPLFVVDYAQPPQSAVGNSYFINKGAMPLRGNGSAKPNLKALFQVLKSAQGSVNDTGSTPASLFSIR